jgi:hypothetical protein
MEGGQVLWQDPLTQTPLMTVEQARNTFRQVLLGLEYCTYLSWSNPFSNVNHIVIKR